LRLWSVLRQVLRGDVDDQADYAEAQVAAARNDSLGDLGAPGRQALASASLRFTPLRSQPFGLLGRRNPSSTTEFAELRDGGDARARPRAVLHPAVMRDKRPRADETATHLSPGASFGRS
jgi:hypothetical protein